MRTYIALLRGINVGGKNALPMKELVGILENLGCRNVKTYIQSGNAVFCARESEASKLSERISTALKKSRGFEPQIVLLGIDELEAAIASNPFPEAESDPKTLHLNFLTLVAKKPDIKAIEAVRGNRERFVLKEKVFYLHAPDGIGRSKLAASAERSLGVAMTGRNWRSVNAILALAKQCK